LIGESGKEALLLPYGNSLRDGPVAKTIRSVDELSHFIRQQRKSIGLSQVELAGASGLGVRFIGDLERGKPTCEIGKTLQVLAMLGIDVQLNPRESINE